MKVFKVKYVSLKLLESSQAIKTAWIIILSPKYKFYTISFWGRLTSKSKYHKCFVNDDKANFNTLLKRYNSHYLAVAKKCGWKILICAPTQNFQSRHINISHPALALSLVLVYVFSPHLKQWAMLITVL